MDLESRIFKKANPNKCSKNQMQVENKVTVGNTNITEDQTLKVFISGSKCINKDGKKWKLPGTVQEYLDMLIIREMEILVGDCAGVDARVQEYLSEAGYNNVKVYVSGSKGTTRNNFGKWEEKHFRANGNTAYAYRLEKDFHMAEDADIGLAIWDGESKGTFINMLCLAAQGKKFKLYLIAEEKWIDTHSLEELKAFAGDEGIIDEIDYKYILEKCGFSDEMIAYIVSENVLSQFQLLDVICQAPVTLDEKMHIFGRLEAKYNLKHDAWISVVENVEQKRNFKAVKHDLRALADFRGKDSFWKRVWDLYREVKDAKDNMYEFSGNMMYERPLYLFTEWYDTEELTLKSSPCGLFVMPESIEKYIINEEAENKWNDEIGEGYYRMETWDVCDIKWEERRYDYYYDCKGRVCWFEKLRPEKQEHGNTYYMLGSRQFASGDRDLNFQTPYHPGDIVVIDCRPFAPVFHAMILEARDQFECCFPNIVFNVYGSNLWRLTSLKHRMFFKDNSWSTYEPMMSPLYRLRKVKSDELTESDSRLIELSEIVAGNEDLAAEIWSRWGGDDLTWDKVREVFA